MANALAAKDSEIEALVSSVDALKKQAALLEGNLALLQVLSHACFYNRHLTLLRCLLVLLLLQHSFV